MPLQPGTRLGRYEIESLLGTGGMGEVYRAHDSRLERTVAVKLLAPGLRDDLSYRQRLEREAKAISKLQHPHVCTLYDLDSANDSHFLVMEYIEGETLQDRLSRGHLSFDDVRSTGVQVADAIHAAHCQGLVHRDLKPGNVILTETGAKVLDFGLAKSTSEARPGLDTQAPTMTNPLTVEGSLVGTLPYMAPEQLSGQDADARTDIWALGCLLYEMSTGDRPFAGDTQASLIASIMSSEPQPPSRIESVSPRQLDHVVKRCLAKKPGQRWASAHDVGRELEAIGAPAARRARRWLGIAAAAALLLTAAVLIARIDWPSSSADPASELAVAVPSSDKRMLILPFHNTGPDVTETAHLADGISRRIGSRLATLDGLSVTSWQTSMHYRDTEKTMVEIAAELGVEWVVAGVVEWSGGDRVRISPSLVRASDDEQLWARDYDREIDAHDAAALFDLQDEIAQRISEQLGLSIVEKAPESIPTRSMEAWSAYQSGVERQERTGDDREDMRLAQAMLEKAVELDPDFAHAWAKLAEVHTEVYQESLDPPSGRAARLERARIAAERAVEIDPDLPAARRALGYYYTAALEHEDALHELEIASRGLPNDSWLLNFLAQAHSNAGDFDEAVEYLERASVVDPLSADHHFWRGWTLTHLRRYAEAERAYERSIELDPSSIYPVAYIHSNLIHWKGWDAWDQAYPLPDTFNMAWGKCLEARYRGRWEEALDHCGPPEVHGDNGLLYQPNALLKAWIHEGLGSPTEAAGHYRQAAEEMEALFLEAPDDGRIATAAGLAWAGLHNKKRAAELAETALRLDPYAKSKLRGSRRRLEAAHIYAQIGEPERAIELLDLVLSNPALFSVNYMKGDPLLVSLHDHPGYVELLEKHG